MKLVIKNVTIVYPELFKAVSVRGGDPAYSAAFLLPKDSDQLSQVKETMKEVATQKWPKDGIQTLKGLLAKDKTCLRDGDEAGYAGFENKNFITSNNKARQPMVKDLLRNDITDKNKIYGGCVVNAVLDIWAQDNPEFGKRVNCTLLGVQFVKDGAPIGATMATDDDFDLVEDDSTEDDDFL